MKSSLFLAATGALLAAAGPIGVRDIEKRAYVTDWVVEIVTVTVTAGDEPTGVIFAEAPQSTSSTPPPPPPPPPAPSTSSTPPPPPPPPSPTPEPSPEPSPEPEPEPEPQPEPEPSPEPAPEPSPEPSPEPEVPSGSNDYITAMLEHHNVHRSNHSAPDLSWDETLASYALNTANSCVFEHDMDQGVGGYGQNLASRGTSGSEMSSSTNSGIIGVTDQWYNGEVNAWTYYGMDDPPQGSDLMAWGHFTQVVWKSTTKVGCATVECAPGTIFDGFTSWYTVCNYDPPGNFGGEYGSNVLEPQGASTLTV